MARILVTGGAGFIGSHLVDALIEQGHSVTVFDNFKTGNPLNLNLRAKLIVGDICNKPEVSNAMRGCDVIFHLAALPARASTLFSWQEIYETNVIGTVRLMDAASVGHNGLPIPVVYASSASVYDARNDGLLKETDPLVCLSSQGAEKLCNEVQAQAAGLVRGLATCGLRFFNVYGPRQMPRSANAGVISIFADRVANGQAVRFFGDGDQERDFIHVSDCVEMLLAARHHVDLNAPVFNACTGVATSLQRLLQAIGDGLNQEPDYRIGSLRRLDARRVVGDPNAATNALGVTAQIGLSEGLKTILCGQVPAQEIRPLPHSTPEQFLSSHSA